MAVTALLLNWKRSHNLRRIIESIKNQSVDIEILLWNNNVDDKNVYDVDLQINSSKNLMCFPRWFLINYAKHNYVFTIDDDLIFKDTRVIEDCLNYLTNNHYMIGHTGVILNESKNYWRSKHYTSPVIDKDVEVDIIKGRFIMAHKNTFKDTNLLIDDYQINIDNPKIEDDIYISSCVKVKKIIPSFLCDRFKNLPEGGVGSRSMPTHNKMRIQYTKKYF